MDIQTVKRHIAVTERLIRDEKAAIAIGRGNPDRLTRLRAEMRLLWAMRRRSPHGYGVITGATRRPHPSDVKALWNDYLDVMTDTRSKKAAA